MYSNDREAYRQTFYQAWQKYQKQLTLEPTEAALIEVVSLHPEYHSLLDKQQGHEFALEENPFVHMSLHMALREQIHLDRPAGIRSVYLDLKGRDEMNVHEVEHVMMDCLARMMWEAQRSGVAPREEDYLLMLREI